MPYLKYTSMTQGAVIIELTKETITIGRADGCTICLKEDKKVSREHSQLIRQPGGGYVVKDLGSKNGTFVNGSPIHTWALKDNDVINVGDTFLTYKEKK